MIFYEDSFPKRPLQFPTMPLRPNDAEIAGMFGELVITNLERGADVETVEEWARYAARYAALALNDREQIAHAHQDTSAPGADVMAWYR